MEIKIIKEINQQVLHQSMSEKSRRASMIICVTTEVILSEKPAEALGVDYVHVMNRVIRKEGDSELEKRQDLYSQAISEVKHRLEEVGIDYRVYDKDTLKFDEMMPAIYEILRKESADGTYVYINISGSTPDYSAAAAIASMMFRNSCQLFSVGTKNGCRNRTLDELKEFYTDEATGRLVGTAKDVTEPFFIAGYEAEPPDERLLKQLKVFGAIPIGKRTNSNVIRNIIKLGLWKPSRFYEGSDTYIIGTSVEMEEQKETGSINLDPEYKKKRASEAVTYQKSMINRWIEGKWIYKDPNETGNKYDLTPKAKDYLKMFCSDEIFEVKKEELDLR